MGQLYAVSSTFHMDESQDMDSTTLQFVLAASSNEAAKQVMIEDLLEAYKSSLPKDEIQEKLLTEKREEYNKTLELESGQTGDSAYCFDYDFVYQASDGVFGIQVLEVPIN